MTRERKKEIVTNAIKNGDRRSYNELMADLELELWTRRFQTEDHTLDLLKKRKY
jgi:hypothetical protein